MLMNRNLKPQKKAAGVNVYKIYLKWIFLLAVVFTYVSVFFNIMIQSIQRQHPEYKKQNLFMKNLLIIVYIFT